MERTYGSRDDTPDSGNTSPVNNSDLSQATTRLLQDKLKKQIKSKLSSSIFRNKSSGSKSSARIKDSVFQFVPPLQEMGIANEKQKLLF